MGRVDGMMIVAVSMMMMLGYLIDGAEAEMDEANVIHVGGKVMCQNCSQSWDEWVQGANPIKGARVSITCLDNRKRVAHYGSDATDDDGDFSLTFDKIIHGKTLNPKDCVLRLVFSPDPTCNIATDFAHGKTGVRLRQPSIVYRDTIKYVLGPFYYTTPECDEPDMTNQNSHY